MKFSELDKSKLTESEIYDLVMSGVLDYSKQKPTEKTKSDILVVLGCSPFPLKARVIKMMHLYKNGYAKNVLFSGGKGWQKLFTPQKKTFSSTQEQSEYLKRLANKTKQMKAALHETIPNFITPKPGRYKSSKGKYRYMHRKLKQALTLPEAMLSDIMRKTCHNIAEIDEDKIFFEDQSQNTIQNLQFSRKLLDELQSTGRIDPVKRMMIITSCFHCRRAALSFKKHFPNVDVLACPATRDFESNGLEFTKESLMSNGYYNQQFKNELDAIINYTRNGSIADMDIEEVLPPEIVKQIIDKMRPELAH